MKKLVKESLNENMGYKSFFGDEVLHKDALESMLRNDILLIIMKERGISEKAFKSIDDTILEIKNICMNNTDIYIQAEKYYQSNKRLNWLTEEIYFKYFKNENRFIT